MLRKTAGKIAGGVVAAGIGIAVIAGCGGSASGFHNMSTLENSVRQQENSHLNIVDPGIVVNNVACVSTGSNSARCVVGDTAGESIDINVLIASNGSSWVSS